MGDVSSKKSGQLNVSITPEQSAFIEKLAKHRITGPELIRGLIDAAADFYDKNGWFSFPATIAPEHFQTPNFMPRTKPAKKDKNNLPSGVTNSLDDERSKALNPESPENALRRDGAPEVFINAAIDAAKREKSEAKRLFNLKEKGTPSPHVPRR